MPPHVASAALSITLTAAACGPPETAGTATDTDGSAPEPDVKGEHVDVYLGEGIEICGGQVAAYDRFLEQVYPFWTGGPLPEDFRVSVDASDSSPCPRSEHSCASDGTAYLVRQYGQYHELVHTVHQRVDGNSASALNEGVATALGADDPLSGNGSYVVGPEVLFSTSPGASDYLPLGLFVRFLIDRDGVQAMRALFGALVQPGDPTPEEIEQQFELAFGEPLTDTWAEFTAQPRCAYDFWFCGDQTDIDLPYELDGLDCADPDVLGFDAPHLFAPPDRPYSPTKLFHLQVVEPTWIQIEYDNVNFQLGQCGDCSTQRLVGNDGPDGPWTISFELAQPGTYFFIVRPKTLDGPPRFSIAAGCSPDGSVGTPPYSCPE